MFSELFCLQPMSWSRVSASQLSATVRSTARNCPPCSVITTVSQGATMIQTNLMTPDSRSAYAMTGMDAMPRLQPDGLLCWDFLLPVPHSPCYAFRSSCAESRLGFRTIYLQIPCSIKLDSTYLTMLMETCYISCALQFFSYCVLYHFQGSFSKSGRYCVEMNYVAASRIFEEVALAIDDTRNVGTSF
jgi:hypothetical protein